MPEGKEKSERSPSKKETMEEPSPLSGKAEIEQMLRELTTERSASRKKQKTSFWNRHANGVLAWAGCIAVLAITFSNWQLHEHISSLAERLAKVESKVDRIAEHREGSATTSEPVAEQDRSHVQSAYVAPAETPQVAYPHLEEKEAELVEVSGDKTEAPLLDNGSNEATADGRNMGNGAFWTVNLMSLSRERLADEIIAFLMNKGVKAEKSTVEVEGKPYYRIHLGCFGDLRQARTYIKETAYAAGYRGAWPSKDHSGCRKPSQVLPERLPPRKEMAHIHRMRKG